MGRKPVKTCPQELLVVIDQVNLLPNDEEQLERFRVQMERTVEVFGPHWNEQLSISLPVDQNGHVILNSKTVWKKLGEYRLIKFEETINKRFDPSQAPLAKLLGPGGWKTIEQKLNRLVSERKNLKEIIRMAEWMKKGRRSTHRFERHTTVTISEEFRIIEIKPDILNTLLDRQIDISRLLECPVCKKIVWRKNLKSETCGKKECSDKLGNQKRRKK